jgi:hypothetical protein
MPQIFPPATNTLAKASLLGAAGLVLLGGWAWGLLLRSPFATQAGVVRAQPVPFSHAHHVGGLGLDCRYCHASVERSAFAGVPSEETCMTCHSQIWTDAEVLAPVREAFRADRPVSWTRVHDLPDFAYFHHAVHVKKGVGCATCHGRLDRMPLTWREETLQMEWCLECHRDPAPHLRPVEAVFDPAWEPAGTDGPQTRPPDARPSVDCSTCHR